MFLVQQINSKQLAFRILVKNYKGLVLLECICNLKVDLTRHHLVPRGLINQGNWCYINATLQALLAISPISRFYKSLKAFLNTNKNYTSTPLTDSM